MSQRNKSGTSSSETGREAPRRFGATQGEPVEITLRPSVQDALYHLINDNLDACPEGQAWLLERVLEQIPVHEITSRGHGGPPTFEELSDAGLIDVSSNSVDSDAWDPVISQSEDDSDALTETNGKEDGS